MCIKKGGGRRLARTENRVDASIQRFEDYIEKNEGEPIRDMETDTDNTTTKRITITRKQKWEEKQIYGRFKRLINNHSPPENLDVAKKRKLHKRNIISLKKSTKQRHKNQTNQSENR